LIKVLILFSYNSSVNENHTFCSLLIANSLEYNAFYSRSFKCAQDSRVQQLQGELEAARKQLSLTQQQLQEQQATKQQLKHLQQQLTEVRQQHLQQLRNAEIAREAAELRAIDLQSQQEQRYLVAVMAFFRRPDWSK
jgi:hypothetical protein